MIPTPFLVIRRHLERLVCHVATRGRHCPSWATAAMLGYVDRPVCRACGAVLKRGDA